LTSRPHLSLVGATATGKTALACAIARAVPGVELVSVDSMSVYRGMDLGTAKPTAEERSAATWHLLDLVTPDQEYSVAQFQEAAREVMPGIESRGHRAVLVGGTGLYHRAVVDDLHIPGRWPEVAAELEARAGRPGGQEELYDELAALDPTAARRMGPTNRRRLLRALEVTLGSGRPFSSYGPGLGAYPESRFMIAGLRFERGVLAERLRDRFDTQLASGLVDEVRRLVSRPGGVSRTARQALGYREVLAHVEDGAPLEAARSEALARIRRFAKRQESWFGRDPRVTWFDAGEPDLVRAVCAAWGVEPAPALAARRRNRRSTMGEWLA
jgi:tRNA dimethylallyltransferase